MKHTCNIFPGIYRGITIFVCATSSDGNTLRHTCSAYQGIYKGITSNLCLYLGIIKRLAQYTNRLSEN